MDSKAEKIAFTAAVVSAFVGNNTVAPGDVPTAIQAVYAAFDALDGQPEPEIATVARPTPAQIRKSITPDALISFEDGKPYKTLKRHLTNRGMTIAEYRAKWGLPADYPSTALIYSEARSKMAKALGLGQGGRGGRGKTKALGAARKG